ncbi:CHAD domain-containing protein [Sphingosinicella sp. LY1275]|uniref:CYTH and CHAD domain-containing protein n=1 Tax=Sphingosinicella sp. LY1275 TaxID=3095379 RepID=UPI002ADEC8D6|nr:CHAD domain-containing protein [Sphingosinicella sp. LY1275]MEA1014141.1 CHAD domain-containing protein [Sphingosinicella sp. LY1275]
MREDQEIELKLEVDEDAAEALARHPALAGRARRSLRQVSTYYDTGKAALRKAGYSLRVRAAEGRFVQTVKQDAAGSAGLFDRPEWERDIEGPGLDQAALAETPLAGLLKPKLRASLAPVTVSDVERTIWLLEWQGAEIEMILDHGSIRGDTREKPLDEIELELKRGEAAALFDLARALARDLPLRIGVLSKSERGFALADSRLGKVAKAGPVRIDPEADAGAGFAAIAHACLKHFRLNEDLVAKRDPAALHQARVAIRRLRAAFSLFGPVVRDEEGVRLREELRWFAGQLGDARNLDVFLGRNDLHAEWRPKLEAAREEAYDRVLAALGSQRLRMLLLNLVAWLAIGAWRQAAPARQPLRGFALDRLDRRWRKVRKAGGQLKEVDEEARHRFRIDVKKLRYAVEFLEGLDTDKAKAKPRKAFLGALEAIQEHLGALNDAATARILLEGLDLEVPADGSGAKAERRHLAAASKAFDKLRAVGPFWRA